MNKWILISILFLSLSVMAGEKKNQDLHMVMYSFYGSLSEMKPFMVSFDEYSNPKNKPKIMGLLKELQTKVETTQVRGFGTPAFRSTYELMGRHIKDTVYLYEKEIFDSSWIKFRSTTQFCLSCHDRLPKNTNQVKWSSDFKKEIKDPELLLKEADFLSIGHMYELAMEMYDQIIRNFKYDSNSHEKTTVLDSAYQRKIAFFARIQRNPNQAIESLKLDLQNPNLPLETKRNIETWIHYFEVWKKEGKADPSKLNDESLIAYATDIIEQNTGGRRITVSDPYVVNLLRVSGLLYERAFKKSKSPYAAEILYLLGKAERDLAPIRSYALSDIYFRDCVLQAPKKPVAKKCFSEYEIAIKSRFRNGASEYIEASLEELRKKMK